MSRGASLSRRQVVAAFAVVAASGASAQPTSPVRIGQFTSAKRAYSTHSYWIEGETGLVLIDTQFLPSDATQFVDLAEASTGKKAVLAVVLHPNPDKFNGVATLQARGIKVVTSQQVLDLIPSVHDIRLGWFFDDFKPDYPRLAPKPESFGNKTVSLRVGGVALTLHALGGAGCSGAHVVAQVGSDLFVGDLLASNGHAWMELGLFDEWQQRLNELESIKPAKIHPGRGPAAGPELIANNRRYLQQVRAIIEVENPKKNSPELGYWKRRSLKTRIVNAYPAYEWDAFVWEALPDLWKKLAR